MTSWKRAPSACPTQASSTCSACPSTPCRRRLRTHGGLTALQVGPWGECSVECDSGVLTRSVQCTSTATGSPVPDAFCPGPMPARIEVWHPYAACMCAMRVHDSRSAATAHMHAEVREKGVLGLQVGQGALVGVLPGVWWWIADTKRAVSAQADGRAEPQRDVCLLDVGHGVAPPTAGVQHAALPQRVLDHRCHRPLQLPLRRYLGA
jgi:Thrombospondin type 1 domain